MCYNLLITCLLDSMEKHKTSKSWLILGVIFIVILFIISYLLNKEIILLSYGAKTLISAIFGFGGVLFLVVGVIKAVIERVRQ